MNSATETPEPAQKKLILTHQKASQTPPASNQQGIGVDGEALKRQQDLVRAGSSGDVKTAEGESDVPLDLSIGGDC